MPALFVFLIKVNLALLVFCAGYYLVLRRLTFYNLNRIYLVKAILFASVYPKINLSASWQRHQEIVRPVQAVIVNLDLPARAILKPLTHPDYWRWAEIVFWAGVVVLALRLCVQLFSLLKIYRNSTAARILGYEVRVMKDKGGPFSFWKNIYVNPDLHEAADLRSILLHEQVHVNDWHSLDIILAELSTVFYWFNPGVWLMKKAVRENIEFITDRKILNNGVDTKQYQYSLVNVSFAAAPQGLVNHFNISTIKKRIIMMNAKRSSKFNLTRYAVLVPAVIALLLVFGISKAALVKKSIHNLHKSVENLKLGRLMLVDAFSQNKVKINDPIVKKTKKQPNDTVTKVKTIRLSVNDSDKLKQLPHVSLSYSKADDTSKLKRVTVTGNVIEPAMYIIDGQIEKDYDISKLNPDDIASIQVGKTPNNGKAVIYIQTKNGVDVKQIKGIRVDGENAKMPRTVIINGRLAGIDTIKIGDRKLFNNKTRLDTTYFSSKKFSGSSLNFVPRKLTMGKVEGLTIAQANSGVSVNHLSDKLIIINGKIASEADLKKLSAFDIDKFVLKTDDETKELYGDKAKNGVVFIVTKKSKSSK
jgi:bla regulator protein BlaR1